MIELAEQQAIEWAYEQTGTIPKAAELLGISAPYLYKRVNRFKMRHLIKQPPKKKRQVKNNAKAPETTQDLAEDQPLEHQ